MKRTAIAFILIFFSALVLEAQPYKFGIGLRGGFTNGVSGKYFFKEENAVEGIFTSRYRGFTITGLYEIQKNTTIENLSWFYGIGGHLATYDSYYYYGYNKFNSYKYKGVYYTTRYSEPVTVLGVDAILGLEYQFEGFPITLGIDTKPYFDILGRSENFFDTSFTIRYVFNGEK